jgi:hypothetical protein
MLQAVQHDVTKPSNSTIPSSDFMYRWGIARWTDGVKIENISMKVIAASQQGPAL